MNNSKLVELLKTITKKEFKDFGLFVESPFFNREKVLVKFYKALENYYPEFSSNKLDKRLMFVKLFAGKHYNDALMRNTVSDFLKLCEEFLKYICTCKETFQNHYLLMKELTNRKQTSLFTKNFEKWKHILHVSKVMDEIYYQNVFIMEDEKRRNTFVKSSKGLYKDDNLDKQAENLHIQHLVENIKLYAIMLNQKKFIYDHKFDFNFFELIRGY